MRTVIGLGSNIGDPIETLQEAVRRIDAIAPVLASSRVYETLPVGGPEQPNFLNAAVLVDWEGDPLDLLDALNRIESELGRVRTVKDGPRTIDLDILWIEALTIDTPRLVVPHPRLAERAFAVMPLLEVAPYAPYTPKDDGILRVMELGLD